MRQINNKKIKERIKQLEKQYDIEEVEIQAAIDSQNNTATRIHELKTLIGDGK
jgi:hypothetical protein